MKKTFPLTEPGRDPARTRDKIRHEINSYLRRTRRRKPPEGFGRWAFACRAGASEAAAQPLHERELGGVVDAVAQAGGASVYVEITATPVKLREGRP